MHLHVDHSHAKSQANLDGKTFPTSVYGVAGTTRGVSTQDNINHVSRHLCPQYDEEAHKSVLMKSAHSREGKTSIRSLSHPHSQ